MLFSAAASEATAVCEMEDIAAPGRASALSVPCGGGGEGGCEGGCERRSDARGLPSLRHNCNLLQRWRGIAAAVAIMLTAGADAAPETMFYLINGYTGTATTNFSGA